MRRASCRGPRSSSAPSSLRAEAACKFSGTRGSGATCAFSDPCASGFCGGQKDAGCGVCADPPVGAACDLVAGPQCLAPARCVVSSDGGTTGTCTLPSAASCD